MTVCRDAVVACGRSVVGGWLYRHTGEGLDGLGRGKEAITYGLWDAWRVAGGCHCGSDIDLEAMLVAHRGTRCTLYLQ